MNVNSIGYDQKTSFKAKLHIPDDIGPEAQKILKSCKKEFQTKTPNPEYLFSIGEMEPDGNIKRAVLFEEDKFIMFEGEPIGIPKFIMSYPLAKPINIHSDNLASQLIKSFKEMLTFKNALGKNNIKN